MSERLTIPVCDIKRLCKAASDAGMSVDRMGLVVENGRLTLLPPVADGGSVAPGIGGDWDKRFAK